MPWTTKRVVTNAVLVGTVAAIASCAVDDASSKPGTSAPTTVMTAGATTSVTAATSTTITAPVSTEWVDPMVEAFAAYRSTRAALNEGFSAQASGPALTEQEFFDLVAARLDGWADAGDVLLEALPDRVPDVIASPLGDVVTAHQQLLVALRESAAALAGGDPEPFNALVEERVAAFEGICAELQGVVQQSTSELLLCGIDGEDPSVRNFEEGPTVDEVDGFVEMPAGSYEIGYLRRAGDEPSLVVSLEYDSDLLVRSSIEVLELTLGDGGPELRLHANEYVAHPTRLTDGELVERWEVPPDAAGDMTPWIEALEGVDVVASGDGLVSGVEARWWDLVNRRETAMSVLGDGIDWLPDTRLEPGRPTRLWSAVVGDHTMLITLHPGGGLDLTDSAADLDVLLAGLDLRPA